MLFLNILSYVLDLDPLEARNSPLPRRVSGLAFEAKALVSISTARIMSISASLAVC